MTERSIAEDSFVGNGLPRLSPLQAVHERLGAQFDHRTGWLIPWTFGAQQAEIAALRQRVGVVDLSANGKLLVKGFAANETLSRVYGSVPAATGEVVEQAFGEGRGYIARLASDEFLIVTPPGEERQAGGLFMAQQVTLTDGPEGATSGALSPSFVALVDQTPGLAGLLILGPDSRDLLGKLCALSFADVDFPDRRVKQSSLAKVHATIIHNNRRGLLAFEIYVERPYGEYVWETLSEAGREFGIMPCGWEAMQHLETD